MPITRKIALLAFLLGCLVLGAAYYLEIYGGLKPCPLCIIQRYLLLIVIVLFLLGGLLPLVNFARRFYHVLVFLVAGLGVAVAGRHFWLTTLPQGQAPSCEASINVMLKYLPLQQVARYILQGGGDCDVTTWQFLHLNLPAWSVIAFIVLAIIALWQIFYKDKLYKL